MGAHKCIIMHYETLQTFIFVIILVELLFLTNFAERKEKQTLNNCV